MTKKMIPVLALALSGAILAGWSMPAAPAPDTRPRPAERRVDPPTLPGISAYAPVRLGDLTDRVGETFSVTIAIDGAPETLKLHPYSIRHRDFRVLVDDADGLHEVPAPASTSVRGIVEGRPGSSVVGGLVGGRLEALIELDGEIWNVQPLESLGGRATGDADHAVFRTLDVEPHPGTCGVDAPARAIEESDLPLNPAGGSGYEVCEIACDADWHFWVDNGSSVQNTVNDVENVLNATSFVYERDVAITYEITTIIVRADIGTNPYSSSNAETLLCQFRDVWNSSPESSIARDVAQLFTGRTLVGTTIGLAWNGVVCNEAASSACGGAVQNLAYSLVESRASGLVWDERVSLSAHELGHNWNAPHCSGSSCHIMCPNINLCGGTTGANLKFGAASIGSISSFRNSRACLEDQPSTLAPPFFDDFPSTVLNGEKWTWISPSSTVAIVTDAVDEPSAPNSIRLRSFGSAEYRDGELRSNFIDLSGLAGQVIGFSYERIGVEAGETLSIDWYSGEHWNALFTLTSDGVDMVGFQEIVLPLPGAAHQDEFRVRFRVEGDDFGDAWYLDDVYVGEFVVDPCPQDIDGNGDVGFNDLLSVLSAWGPCVGACPQDIDESGDVGFSDVLSILSAWGPC